MLNSCEIYSLERHLHKRHVKCMMICDTHIYLYILYILMNVWVRVCVRYNIFFLPRQVNFVFSMFFFSFSHLFLRDYDKFVLNGKRIIWSCISTMQTNHRICTEHTHMHRTYRTPDIYLSTKLSSCTAYQIRHREYTDILVLYRFLGPSCIHCKNKNENERYDFLLLLYM